MGRRVFVVVLLLLAGCASMQVQPPDVVLANIRPLPSTGLEPRFQVDLRLINPNDREIPIKGGAFKLYLQGARIASGVIGRPVAVPAFGDALVSVEGSGDLLGGLVMFQKIVRDNPDRLNYRIEVSLSRENSLLPLMLEREGIVDLRLQAR